MLERTPGPVAAGPGLRDLVAEVEGCLAAAGHASLAPLDDVRLGEVVTALARVESRAAALRLTLSAEADRRRVAEGTAETGTDAWLARLTGGTREQMAGGLRIARLLQEKYPTTREAFAAGELRVEQVRVIVNAAEQAPVEATPEQVTAAEAWLVGRATGAGTRTGRPTDAKRLRQAARRMFAALDADLAARHEAILLGRESRTAETETFLALHDNGDGTFTGRFRIPELQGHLLTQALDRLIAPRRLARDRAGGSVVDASALGHDGGAHVYETRGAAWCELIEHLPTRHGHGGNGCELLVAIDLDSLLDRARHRPARQRRRHHGRRGSTAGLRRGARPGRPRRRLAAARPRPLPAPPHPHPAPSPFPAPRDVRRRRLSAALRLVRDPPPTALEQRRRH